jgi:hypothetical protein
MDIKEEKTKFISEEITRIQRVIEGKEADERKFADYSETPYDGWVRHQLQFHFAKTGSLRVIPGCPACKKYLEDWILFLKSL